MRLRDSVQQHINIKSDKLFEDQGLDILAQIEQLELKLEDPFAMLNDDQEKQEDQAFKDNFDSFINKENDKTFSEMFLGISVIKTNRCSLLPYCTPY